jgi:sortase A
VFVLLHKVDIGDTYMLNYAGKQYVYKVINRKIVAPNDVSVLLEQPKPAISTLITCDPPGTSNNRLIVQGEQISPAPSTNSAAPAAPSTNTPATLPGNAPSLWSRFIHWLF